VIYLKEAVNLLEKEILKKKDRLLEEELAAL
jgi:hypothetical protein